MLKRLGLLCTLTLLSSPCLAADGRISYVTADGSNANAAVVSPVCSVSSDGTSETCADGLSASVSSSGLMSYKTASGMVMGVLPVVPVCSVNSAGVPQICDMSGGTSDLSAYLTTAAAATTYVPQSQLGVNGGVATLDASGNVTAPINTTGTAKTGALTVTSTTASIQGSVSGTTRKWTLSRRSQDTYTSLNSYNGSKWSPFTFNDDGTLDSTVGVFANLGADAPFTGTVSAPTISATSSATAPTPATTDNSTAVATTAFVNNAFQSVEYSSQGDVSTAGSSIQVAFGTSGLYAKFAYTAAGSASMSFCSSSGTLSPVDIRRNSIWGGSGVETYTLDNGSVDTSCVVADSTVYTSSQDSSAYFIRVGGAVYFLTVWASNNGARAFMGVHRMI